MHDSPRIRRLKSDYLALKQVCRESSIFLFDASGNPPCRYLIMFQGKGLCRDRGKIKVIHEHQVEIKLGASYPRTMPEIRWLTPVYHPNISEIGMVCLGGFGTHWVPSVQLDELCTMLWDMVRYHNYDIRSPYNRDAALWVANQTAILFPTDARVLRDRRVAQGRVVVSKPRSKAAGSSSNAPSDGRLTGKNMAAGEPSSSAMNRVRMFIQRYSRVFGDATGLDREAPPVAMSGEGSVAPATESQETSALLSKEWSNGENAAAPLALGSAFAQLWASAEPARSQGESGESLVILENDPADRPDEPARPARQDGSGDEIVFIE